MKKKSKKPTGVPEKEPQYSYRSSKEKCYIEDRLLPQLRYYSATSRRFQTEYYVLSIINIAVLALIPVFTMLIDILPIFRYVVTGASAIISILSSILLVRQSKDNWLDYRITAENLKVELAKYRAKAGEYCSENPCETDLKLSLFVENCEQIMRAEHTGWHSRMQEESDQK